MSLKGWKRRRVADLLRKILRLAAEDDKPYDPDDSMAGCGSWELDPTIEEFVKELVPENDEDDA